MSLPYIASTILTDDVGFFSGILKCFFLTVEIILRSSSLAVLCGLSDFLVLLSWSVLSFSLRVKIVDLASTKVWVYELYCLLFHWSYWVEILNVAASKG